MRAKATSLDIAYRAGVSQSTVSRALRNSPLVSEETRKKVQEIARELNYTVDKNASNLRKQQSGTLALLLFEDPTDDNSAINPFFLSMLGSITRACGNNGYDLLVSFQQMSDNWHADFEDSNKADGLILLGYGDYVHFEEKLKHLAQLKTHYVSWGAELKQAGAFAIGSDNIEGGRQATQHIIDKGHKRIAFLGTASTHAPEFFDRYKGYCQAIEGAGLTVDPKLQRNALYTEEAGYKAACELLDSKHSFDAIFAACDLIAIGAMRALKAKGLKVPEDVAVVGFDDIVLANFSNPPLTTMKQDTLLAGELLVKTLIDSIVGREVNNVLITPKLIVRESS